MSTPVNTPEKQRLDWIDQTKGLAILGILFFHFFQNYPDKLSLVSLLDRNGAKIGYAAVDIFFVMAGFNTSYILAAASEKYNLPKITTSWKSWLLKRLDRIYPTYFLAVVCSLFLYFIFGYGNLLKSPLKFILFFQYCLGLYWGIIYHHHQNRFRTQDFTLSGLAFGFGLIFYLYIALTKADIVYILGFDILFTALIFLGCHRLFERLNEYKGHLFYGLALLSAMGIYSYQINLIHQPLFFVIFPIFNRCLSLNPYLKIIISIIGISILLSIYCLGFIRLEQWIRKIVKKQFKPSF